MWNVTRLQEGVPVTTVLICDDRRGVREGLTRVMSAVPGVSRIDCVAHGDELLARYSRQPVDVVLVGTQRAVPTGVEATRRLVAAHPQANVIVFGAPDDAGSIAAAIAGGARGYLRWDASRPELVAALAHTLASTAVPTPRAPTDPGVQLTERELQGLRGQGDSRSTYPPRPLEGSLSVTPGRTSAMSRSIDEELAEYLAAAIAGDRVAVERVLKTIRPLVVRYCRARLGRYERTFASA